MSRLTPGPGDQDGEASSSFVQDASDDDGGSYALTLPSDPFLESAFIVCEQNHTGPEVPDLGTKSLRSIAEICYLKELRQMLHGESPPATSVCDGEVELSQPVTVRWDLGSRHGVVRFPAPPNDDSFQHLHEICQSVVSEEKQLHLKLHKTDFTTDFHPYDYGINHIIEQLMLPSILNASEYSNLIGSKYFGVKTELETLNVRLGFANNEPRSEADPILNKNQFGFLIVPLPSLRPGM